MEFSLILGLGKAEARKEKPEKKNCEFLASAIRILYGCLMFEVIKDQLTGAAEKLAHLRRFL